MVGTSSENYSCGTAVEIVFLGFWCCLEAINSFIYEGSNFLYNSRSGGVKEAEASPSGKKLSNLSQIKIISKPFEL